MTDWHEHNGGPQPIADDVWVEAYDAFFDAEYADSAAGADWKYVRRWRILNQHLIRAARLEGIRLGLEAADKAATEKVEERIGVPCPDGRKGCLVFHHRREHRDKSAFEIRQEIRALDPATIAREATLDTLTAEAQANGMGYDQHDTKRHPAALIGQEANDENK